MAQTALQTLIEKLDEVKLLDGFNGHYHSGCNMAKEIIKSLATELLPKEREDIKDGIRIVAPMLVFMMPADAEQMAEDYFTQTFNGQTTPSVGPVQLESLVKFVREEFEPEFVNGNYWVDILDDKETQTPITDKEVVERFLSTNPYPHHP